MSDVFHLNNEKGKNKKEYVEKVRIKFEGHGGLPILEFKILFNPFISPRPPICIVRLLKLTLKFRTQLFLLIIFLANPIRLRSKTTVSRLIFEHNK